jgi:hypothetical protein
VRALLIVVTLAALAAGCEQKPLAELDGIYSSDGARRVLCAVNLDATEDVPFESIEGGLARAHERGEVIHLYAHSPGISVSRERLDAVLTKADSLGLVYVTYAELGDAPPASGALALSFDDANVDSWFAMRDLFAAHQARVTFFVSRFDQISAAGRLELHALADAGHDVEAHGLRHVKAPDYVREYGLDAYLNDEVVPALELLRQDGFSPTVFAYPYGQRNEEIDEAVLGLVARVRSVSFAYGGLISDPCPE